MSSVGTIGVPILQQVQACLQQALGVPILQRVNMSSSSVGTRCSDSQRVNMSSVGIPILQLVNMSSVGTRYSDSTAGEHVFSRH